MADPRAARPAFTVFLTDAGGSGTDSVAFDGPNAGTAADCDATSPTQTALTNGGVTVLNGPSDSGTVSGSGTSNDGFQTTTFEFDGERQSNGTVSGTYSISTPRASRRSARSSASTSAVTTRWSSGHGTQPGGGVAVVVRRLYATFFVDDHGAYGSGDQIAFNAYTNVGPPPACLAAQETRTARRHHRRHQRQRPARRWQPTAGGEGRREWLHPELPGRRVGLVRGLGHLRRRRRRGRHDPDVAVLEHGHGRVTCLLVAGNSIVVGGQQTTFNGGGGAAAEARPSRGSPCT